MIQIYLLLQKVYRVYKINTPQCTDIGHHNHIFKVVKVILQRSVTFIVNSEGKKYSFVYSSAMDFNTLGYYIGGGGSVSGVHSDDAS